MRVVSVIVGIVVLAVAGIIVSAVLWPSRDVTAQIWVEDGSGGDLRADVHLNGRALVKDKPAPFKMPVRLEQGQNTVSVSGRGIQRDSEEVYIDESSGPDIVFFFRLRRLADVNQTPGKSDCESQ